MPDKLIFDRSPESYWNADDLNRIEEWCKFLADRLSGSGYDITYIPHASWTTADIPTLKDINRIRANINVLRDGFFSIPEWRELLTGNRHDYTQANAMEWDLQQCYDWLENMIQSFVYSGEVYCGEVI